MSGSSWLSEQAFLSLKESLLRQQAVVFTAISSRVLKILPGSVAFDFMTLTFDFDFTTLTLTLTLTADTCLPAYLLHLRRTFLKLLAAVLETKAFGFKVAHVIPDCLLTLAMVTAGDYIPRFNLRQCMCVCMYF